MSLRARLLAGFALIAVVLAGVLIFITRSTRDDLVAQIDLQLERAVGPGRGAVPDRQAFDGSPPTRDANGAAPPRQLSTLYIARMDGDAVETLIRPGLGAVDAALPDIDPADVARSAETGAAFTASTSDDDLRYRARADPNPVTGELLIVALPMNTVDDAVESLVRVEAAGAGIIVLVLGLVAWWVIRLGITPVREMTAVATAIADGDLTQRAPDSNPHTEAGALGVALNRMLASIETAFGEKDEAESRLRRFVADASHELKTPLSTIRGYAELYRAGALVRRSDLQDAMRRTEQESIRMGGLIDDLLDLAHLDEGRPLEFSLVDLVEVADDACRDASAVQPKRRITVQSAGTVGVWADEAKVRQVVANLLANALTHTPEHSSIEVRVAVRPDAAILEVCDHGPGMSAEAAERAFERFYRADPSRSRRSGGSGLGLAIVQSVVTGHGGKVELRSSPQAGTTVRVELPLVVRTPHLT